MGKKKPRQSPGWRIVRGDRVLEYSVSVPERWEHRHRLVEIDTRYGMSGAWVKAIGGVFDDAWLREQVDAAHYVARAMSWPYPYAILALAEVADLVLAVRAAESGAESVLKRLRVHEQYAGACFEARVARWLAAARLPFRFARSTGPRAADIAVGGTLPFGIEVKHVANAERSKIEETLSNLISPDMFFARRDAGRFRFDWSGREVQETPLAELTLERLHDMVARVHAAVRERLQSAAAGESLEIPIEDIGTVFVSLDAPADRTSIGIETYGGDACRNALRLAKQIHHAAEQLEPSMPGIVVLGAAPLVLEAEHAAKHVTELLVSAGGAMDHVAGAIVVGASPEGPGEHTIPIRNPHGRVPLDALPLPVAHAPGRTNRFGDFGDLFTWRE